jgi:hypothetical protein
MINLNARDSALFELARRIVADDAAGTSRLLAASPALARACFENGVTRQTSQAYLDEIGRYIYEGDTALHIAAAIYRTNIVQALIAKGADARARNRLGAEPLHAAAMGQPGSPTWNPHAQAATVACLIAAGADPNALDKFGVPPLHRAVRTRCAAAVTALLAGGADIKRKNGSTPMQLANVNSGRGGSGSPEAKAQQQEIIGLLEQHLGTRQ